jgi:hypothetical protein
VSGSLAPGSGLSRRAFLRGSGWAALAGGLALATAGAAGAVARLARPPSPGARLAGALAHGEGAKRVGRAAIAAGVVEGDPRALLAGLTAKVPDLALLLRDGSDDDLRYALDAARRRDFTDYRSGIVRVDGWVLARTEACACALVALG